MRLVFAGTPEVALPSLRALLESGRHEVVAVVTRPDAPAGRGRRVERSPVAALADERGIEVLSPKFGVSLGETGSGWSHSVYTLTPGVPGDSGSGFLDADGNALGTLSTLALAPLPASNGVGDLNRELQFAQQHSGISGLRLVPGTEPFSPLL